MMNPETQNSPEKEATPAANTQNEMSPRQTALDTLQTLIPFTSAIAALSRSVGERLWANEPASADFERMLEGIEILVDGVQTSRAVLGFATHEGTDPLHRELVALLQELTAAMENSAPEAMDQRINLLTAVIPAHLNEWVSSGIPSLLQNQG